MLFPYFAIGKYRHHMMTELEMVEIAHHMDKVEQCDPSRALDITVRDKLTLHDVLRKWQSEIRILEKSPKDQSDELLKDGCFDMAYEIMAGKYTYIQEQSRLPT